MSKVDIYFATINVAIKVPEGTDHPHAFAADAISESLPRFNESELMDWGYAYDNNLNRVDDQTSSPIPQLIAEGVEESEIEEGTYV